MTFHDNTFRAESSDGVDVLKFSFSFLGEDKSGGAVLIFFIFNFSCILLIDRKIIDSGLGDGYL
jgi:hypothetical protein